MKCFSPRESKSFILRLALSAADAVEEDFYFRHWEVRPCRCRARLKLRRRFERAASVAPPESLAPDLWRGKRTDHETDFARANFKCDVFIVKKDPEKRAAVSAYWPGTRSILAWATASAIFVRFFHAQAFSQSKNCGAPCTLRRCLNISSRVFSRSSLATVDLPAPAGPSIATFNAGAVSAIFHQ